MGFPAGMQLATIMFGIPLTVTGKNVRTHVTVKPTARVFWAATGQPLPEFSDSFTAEGGQLGQFQVPYINQSGFIDSTGAEVTDFAYQIFGQWEFGNERPIPWDKNIKPLLGQTAPIDLDLVPDGPVSIPVTAPTAAVLGFHGRTGFVTLLESDLPSRLSPEGLSATYALKGNGQTRAERYAAIVRPAKYLATLHVDPAGGGTHTTINDAIAAARTLQGNSGTVGVTIYDPFSPTLHPDRMVRIVVAAGTYSEQVSPCDWIHLIGATGNPDDVVIQSALTKGAMQNGFYAMIEHVTAHGTGTWYGLHMLQAGVSVWHNCKIVCDVANGEILGLDGYGGSLGLFLGCAFSSTGATPLAMNTHGLAGNKQPLTLAFVDCTHPTGLKYADLASGMADTIHVLGGSIGAVTLDGANVVGVLDPAAVTSVTRLNGAKAPQYVRAAPPLPPGFLRQSDLDYFYPVGSARGAFRPSVQTGTAAASPTAARTYYIPLTVDSYRKLTTATVGVETAAGTISVGLVQDDGTGKPGKMLSVGGSSPALTVGKNAPTLFYPAHVFPGNALVFAAIQFSDAAASVIMSPMMSTLTNVWYQDGAMPARNAATTPVALPAGTPAPFVTFS